MPSSLPDVNGRATSWAAISGKWDFAERSERYLGSQSSIASQGQDLAWGLAVSSLSMQSGSCEADVEFAGPLSRGSSAGGIIVGYQSAAQPYIVAQLGAHAAYTLAEFVSGFGWRPLAATGQIENLRSAQKYHIKLLITGQELRFLVDDVPVLTHLLAHPLVGRQVGLIAQGTAEVSFSNFTVRKAKPRAFVAMQYAEPYDTFYKQVIQAQAVDAGFEVVRIDEKAGPGIIFQDMQREIQQAEVVIAEITPVNPNVFYEVGYAHALEKPTILLAQRGSELPFDIRSFPVVYYNDSIGGKAEVERSLGSHLRAIANRDEPVLP